MKRAAPVLIATAAIVAPLDAPRAAGVIARHEARAGAWRLTIARNRFSETVFCRLRGPRMRVESGAVAFRAGRGRGVDGAVYRLDGGPPRRWRDDFPALARLGAPVETGGMDDPARGLVWLPLALLEGVRSVAIQPDPRHAPRAFRLTGLAGLLASARTRGCTDDRQFVA